MSGTADAPGQVRLVVSHDYGEQLFDEGLRAENALALTKLHLQVETDQAAALLPGLRVGAKITEQNAWFFYYNGVYRPVAVR